MRRIMCGFAALALLSVGVAAAQAAGPGYYSRGYYYPSQQSGAYNYPAQGRAYSTVPRTSGVWPYYPNYGNNPVGAAYSQAAGMRPGQFFGTFGLRPADARARGAY